MNPLERLGLPAGATALQVKQRWRKLCTTHHPDHGGDAAAFHALRVAYQAALAEASAPRPCQTCGGAGKLVAQRGFSTVGVLCPTCGGNKVVINGL